MAGFGGRGGADVFSGVDEFFVGTAFHGARAFVDGVEGCILGVALVLEDAGVGCGARHKIETFVGTEGCVAIFSQSTQCGLAD